MIRNALATLLLAQGTPMMLAGDEFGRTQGGNNNAYCQDDEISWLDWESAGKRRVVDCLYPPADEPAPQISRFCGATSFSPANTTRSWGSRI